MHSANPSLSCNKLIITASLNKVCLFISSFSFVRINYHHPVFFTIFPHFYVVANPLIIFVFHFVPSYVSVFLLSHCFLLKNYESAHGNIRRNAEFSRYKRVCV